MGGCCTAIQPKKATTLEKVDDADNNLLTARRKELIRVSWKKAMMAVG